MSKRILARCGERAGKGDAAEFDKIVDLCQTGPDANVDLKVYSITSRILGDLSERGRDLLDIATYVYVLDSTVRRGGLYDVYGTRWSRDFTLRVPVRDVATWDACSAKLEALLQYLTDDRYSFEFSRHPGDTGQRYLEFKSQESYPAVDCVCLFSGGADSLGGALQLYGDGRKPLLVSHRSAPPIDARQSRLREDVYSFFGGWTWPHLSLWAHRQGSSATEHTQRSRSFLFLSLATVVASELGLDEICVPENGIVSINLPKLEQAVGARASRSTQPRFVSEFQGLASRLFGRDLRLTNPLLFKTKAEVLSTIEGSGHPELLESSVSCVHTRGRTKAMPHCGGCSQCVDRRFSSIAAGMETYDPPERYELDIFSDPLEGEAAKQFEAYVRAARRFRRIGPDEFITGYRQVTDALRYIDERTDQAAQDLYELHQRFAKQALDVLQDMVRSKAGDAALGTHPPTGFLSRVADGRLEKKPASVLADLITEVLQRDLPIRFQSNLPESERALQDAMEAALKSAEKRLRREGPTIPYSVVETVPDFSSEEARNDLYVEAKLVKDSDSRRYAVKSIGEASSYYVAAGAWALFVVYDTDRHITDDHDFAIQFEKKGRVSVAVIR